MRTWLAVLAAAVPPAVLALLGLSHPHTTDLDASAWWRDLHVIGLTAFPLLALAPWVSVRGRARVGRGGMTPMATTQWVVGALGLIYASFYIVLDLLAASGVPAVATAVGPGPWVTELFGDAPGFSITGVWAYLAETAVAAAAIVVTTGGGRRVVATIGGLVAVAGAGAFLAGQIYYPISVLTMVVLGAGQTALAVAAHREPRRAPSTVSG